MSLNEVLKSLGLAHCPGRYGLEDIVDSAGAVLFTGDAGRTWDWLRATGRYTTKT